VLAVLESVIYVGEAKWTYRLVKNAKWKLSIRVRYLKILEAGSVYQRTDLIDSWII
jgi:hypothetical protein